MSTEQRLAALERRIERLEATDAPPLERAAERSAGEAALRLLDRLREQLGQGETSGAISYAGAAGMAGREYLWAKEHQVADVVAADLSGAAAVLECLGSPARLALLAAAASAPRSRAELQEILGDTSTGHLYHHLRTLQAAGLLRQPRRGEYAVATEAVVPALTIIAAALDLGDSGTGGDE